MTALSADRILSAVTPIMSRFSVPGAGVAAVSGEESLALGYGICEKDGGNAVVADTTFQLASCSKAYTATTAALLVDSGVITWDDPVQKHLPEFQMHDARLTTLATLRDLLSMRLGYRNEGIVSWGRNLELGNEVIFERLRHLEVVAGFRELFTYLNPAYTLIAEVITRRSGKPLAAYQGEALNGPLGQTNTFSHEGRLEPKHAHAFPHVELNEGVVPVGMAHCGGRVGESCVYSSANDAARWLRLHLGNGEIAGRRIVSAAAMGEMHRPHVYGPGVPALDNHFLSYGMGWQCRDTPNGPILLHEGGEFGVSTFTILDPLRHNGAAIYANLNSSAAVKAAAYTLLDLLAGRTPRDWASLFERLSVSEHEMVRNHIENALARHAQPAHDTRDIVGSYFNPANGTIDIRETAEGLDMCVRDGWVYDCVLERMKDNLYRGHPRFRGMQSLARAGMRARFVRDDEGFSLHAPGLGISRKVA